MSKEKIEQAVLEPENEQKKVEENKEEENKEEEVIERPYKLRRLKDSDLFLLLKILKKIGIKDYKEAFIQVVSGEKTLKQIGIMASFDIADILIGNLAKVVDETYEMWSDISGIPIEDMKEMEFGTLPLMIIDTFSEARNTSFFKVLSKFLS
ncbi:MAG: hypothetical protein OSJ60_01990 [Lachnospiraceae bacterium]|nr:hypothetical protein C819_02227 [Lachnospiraceae bacterium 10-1]MCX4350384.1 hypothetical protein [Lachnospiraceae bacterium]